MRTSFVAPILLAFSALCAAQHPANWSYFAKTGPLEWGKLAPAYQACSKGHEQSPVDIRHARLNKNLQPIEFHYIAGPVTLVNTGHTVEVHVDPGSYIVAGGVRYDLIQFHFHHPGETPVNGKLSDLELHLVHRNADGKLAVLAVRLSVDRGFPNATMATLWDHLPATAGASAKVADMVNAAGLIPADRGYWTYTGSLTAPPCTEGVRWFVFEDQLSISRDQARAFSNLYKMNTRPLQDLHGRRIEANE